MPNLRPQLQSITNEFVAAVLAALRSASLEDIAGETSARVHAGTPRTLQADVAQVDPRKPARTRGRRRASAAQVMKEKAAVFEAAKKLKSNFKKADIVKATGLTGSAGRMLSLLVEEGKLAKKGDRRLTSYAEK